MADQNDAPLSAAQRSKIRRLSQPKEPEVGEEAGELNVVPYLDIITNVMIFVLASVSVTFVTSIETEPPSIGGGKVRSEISSKALNLSAFITKQGISLKTSGGNIAPGCETAGAGVTIPKLPDDRHDLVKLTACAKKLKGSNPDFRDETQVTITANPDTEYTIVIGVMDSLRRDGEEVLFPDVHFGVAR
jgi:biopolymer transport protein ExbD